MFKKIGLSVFLLLFMTSGFGSANTTLAFRILDNNSLNSLSLSQIPSPVDHLSLAGYYETAPTTFSWYDAANNGNNTNLSGDDNVYTTTLPFSFPFYNQTFDDIYISTNGWLSFNISNNNYEYVNPQLPTGDVFSYAIMPFFNDLEILTGNLYTMNLGSIFVIEYNNFDYLRTENTAGTFQVVLYQNGDIKFQYQNVLAIDPNDSWDKCEEYSYNDIVSNRGYRPQCEGATIGLNRGDNLYYNQYIMDQDVSNFAILYERTSVPSVSVGYSQSHPGWMDYNATILGTNLLINGDDTFESLDLPFTFPFYDQKFDTVYISSNGWMSFTETYPTEYLDPQFPNTNFTYVISPWWDDLIANNNIYYYAAPDNSFVIIEYTNYQYLTGALAGNFQVYLFDDGRVRFQYLDISLDVVEMDSPNGFDQCNPINQEVIFNERGYYSNCDSVVGLNKGDGTYFSEYLFDRNIMNFTNNLTIEYAPQLQLTNSSAIITSWTTFDNDSDLWDDSVEIIYTVEASTNANFNVVLEILFYDGINWIQIDTLNQNFYLFEGNTYSSTFYFYANNVGNYIFNLNVNENGISVHSDTFEVYELCEYAFNHTTEETTTNDPITTSEDSRTTEEPSTSREPISTEGSRTTENPRTSEEPSTRDESSDDTSLPPNPLPLNISYILALFIPIPMRIVRRRE